VARSVSSNILMQCCLRYNRAVRLSCDHLALREHHASCQQLALVGDFDPHITDIDQRSAQKVVVRLLGDECTESSDAPSISGPHCHGAPTSDMSQLDMLQLDMSPIDMPLLSLRGCYRVIVFQC
jgi:hypothetical protein